MTMLQFGLLLLFLVAIFIGIPSESRLAENKPIGAPKTVEALSLVIFCVAVAILGLANGVRPQEFSALFILILVLMAAIFDLFAVFVVAGLWHISAGRLGRHGYSRFSDR